MTTAPKSITHSSVASNVLARKALVAFGSLLDQGLLTSVLADPTRSRREVEARGLRDIEIWPLEFFLASLWRDELRRDRPDC